jgi:succinyl-CoA synthetase beta subunit
MITEVKGLSLLRGYRGQAAGDMQALAETIVAFSALAAAGHVIEAEINPLIVKAEGEGVIAVDGLVRLSS